MSDPRHELGRRAEGIIEEWLAAKGWRILDRRWRGSRGELDLVCLDPGGVLVGVEVKLRRSGRTGSGAESVDRRRVARLRGALAAFAASEATAHHAVRLDLVMLAPAGDGVWRVRRLPGIDAW
jgi:putative endonuclease